LALTPTTRMTATRAEEGPGPFLHVLRDSLRRYVTGTSLRRVAGEVGLSPSRLQKFLEGAEPFQPNAAQPRLWEVPGVSASDHAGLAIRLLVGGLPEDRRDYGTVALLGALRSVYGGHPPAWITELDRRTGVSGGQPSRS
jgi:hypothetical protein